MSVEPLAFGPFRLNSENGTLLRDGELVPVGQKGALILARLLANPGEVTTKAQLVDAAWPGLSIEESNLSVQIAALRKALGEAPGGGEWIVTVARVGYRILAETGAAAQRTRPRPSLALPDKPSIAVLPFQNMSGDPEQEYFADGMVDDIIVGLSRIKWLFVIARNSSFVFKGQAVDVRQVGRELGVRYVLEGGVRKAGSRVRITAQLIEAETGVHLWADKYDGSLEDIFDLQDQITDKVVGIVEPSLQRSEIERSRRKRPENLDAYDLYLRALPYMGSGMPPEARIAAALLQDALKLDPDYAAAHALLSWCHERCYMRGGFDEADKVAGLRHARAAIASGTDDTTTLAVGGLVIMLLGRDRETALSAIQHALLLNPSCATALYLAAPVYAFAGRSIEAVTCADRALRLSPFDLLAHQGHQARLMAAIQDARFDDAALHAARMVHANPGMSTDHFCLAISLALAGRLEEARPWVRRGLELEPGFRMRIFRELGTPQINLDRVLEGGRLLGLME
jgi:adenylate cyclase